MGSKGKKHITRLAAPKTWKIKKKGVKYIIKPKPGMHSIKIGLPLNVILKDLLDHAKSSKEVKKILNNQEILVDQKRRKDPAFVVGFMDIISIPKLKEHYRVLLNKKGYLVPIKIDEKQAKLKLCKVNNKTLIKGAKDSKSSSTLIKKQIQLNLFDGRNILIEKTDIKTGDTLVIEVPSQKIIDSFKFEKGATIYLSAGKHAGYIGKIEDIKENKIIFKTKSGDNIETLKKYAFVIGKEKPFIKTIEDEQK